LEILPKGINEKVRKNIRLGGGRNSTKRERKKRKGPLWGSIDVLAKRKGIPLKGKNSKNTKKKRTETHRECNVGLKAESEVSRKSGGGPKKESKEKNN